MQLSPILNDKLEDDRRLRVDFHVHTRYSHDATTTLEQLLERMESSGMDRVVVADHGEIEGAFRAQELAPERIIVGSEIRCRCLTEIIGVYLTEHIPSGLHLEEVVERARAQGALLYAPHPFAYPWKGSWHAERALSVADIVEGFNSRAFWAPWNEKAHRAARERGLPLGAGSDAHFPWEVGRAFAELPYFDDAESLRRVMIHSTPNLRKVALAGVHVASVSLAIPRVLYRRVRKSLSSSSYLPTFTSAPTGAQR